MFRSWEICIRLQAWPFVQQIFSSSLSYIFSLSLSLPPPPHHVRVVCWDFSGLPLTLYEAEADFELLILPPPTPKCEDCRQYHRAWLRNNALILSKLTHFPLHPPPCSLSKWASCKEERTHEKVQRIVTGQGSEGGRRKGQGSSFQ